MIKKILKKYRRRRILRDIKKAKMYYQAGKACYMCQSFVIVSGKYFRKPIDSIIPEFNKDFLNAQYKDSYLSIWWDVSDRESRIKAFDKLIETYSKKEQRQKKN